MSTKRSFVRTEEMKDQPSALTKCTRTIILFVCFVAFSSSSRWFRCQFLFAHFRIITPSNEQTSLNAKRYRKCAVPLVRLLHHPISHASRQNIINDTQWTTTTVANASNRFAMQCYWRLVDAFGRDPLHCHRVRSPKRIFFRRQFGCHRNRNENSLLGFECKARNLLFYNKFPVAYRPFVSCRIVSFRLVGRFVFAIRFGPAAVVVFDWMAFISAFAMERAISTLLPFASRRLWCLRHPNDIDIR